MVESLFRESGPPMPTFGVFGYSMETETAVPALTLLPVDPVYIPQISASLMRTDLIME
jgi:hypothetical protein